MIFKSYVLALPGLSLAIAIFLTLLGLFQINVYRSTKYQRWKSTALFSIFSAYPCYWTFLIQSDLFSPNFLITVGSFLILSISFARHFYINSINYFIAIPDKYFKAYMTANWGVTPLAIIPLIHTIFIGPELMTDLSNKTLTGNVFMDIFVSKVGNPAIIPLMVLSFHSFCDILMATYLFFSLKRTSRDMWFMAGMAATTFAALFETLLLPITMTYFFPTYYISNLIESGRMSYLSAKDYLLEQKAQKIGLAELSKDFATKYQNSRMTDARILEICQNVRVYLKKSKIYKRPNLTIDELANEVEMPTYQLSQALNIGLNKNFSEVINEYRINSIKEELSHPGQYSKKIMDVALENGFKSKSSFNYSFKKVTGTTPSAYRNSPQDVPFQ